MSFDQTSIFPVSVIWDITYECNVRCKHCYNSAGESSQKELTTKQAYSVIDQLAGLGVFSIDFGGGEPFLRPDYIDIVRRAVDSGIDVTMSTNGVLITQNLARKIKDAGMTKIQMSIYGAGPKVHDGFTCMPGSHQKLLEGLRILNDENILTPFLTVITECNYKEIPRLIELARQYKVKSHTFSRFVPIGRGADNKEELSLSHESEKETVRYLLRRKEELADELEISVDTSFAFLLGKPYDKFYDKRNICEAGRLVCYIAPDGKVLPCQFLPIPLGNLKTTSLRSIWKKSSVLKKIRSEIVAGPSVGKCSDCEHRRTCRGGCRGLAYVINRDLRAADPRCWHNPYESQP